MHANILQESASLLKELTSMNRKVPGPQKSLASAKKQKNSIHTQAFNLNQTSGGPSTHKRQPSATVGSATSPISLRHPPVYTNIQERFLQMHVKSPPVVKNEKLATQNNEFYSVYAHSAQKNQKLSDDKKNSTVNLRGISSHYRDRSSDRALGIERNKSFSRTLTYQNNSEVETIQPKTCAPDSPSDRFKSRPLNSASTPKDKILNIVQANLCRSRKNSTHDISLSTSQNPKPSATKNNNTKSSRTTSPDVSRILNFDFKGENLNGSVIHKYLNQMKKDIKLDIPQGRENVVSSQRTYKLFEETGREKTVKQRELSQTPQGKSVRDIGLGLREKPLNIEIKREIVSAKSTVSNPASCMGEKNSVANQPKYVLTDEEKNSYGDRFPKEYTKLDFLGRGGFALVWLGLCKSTGRKVAVKQMLKNAMNDSQRKELYYGQLIFQEGGEPREEFFEYPGVHNICAFIDSKYTKTDYWHVFELGGGTLSKSLFEIKGEFYKGERIYGVKQLELYQRVKEDGKTLKDLLRKMAETLHLLSDYKIVHCDIKPDNILVDTKSSQLELKLIDFGSAYNWDEAGNIGMATPEYMPPEFLQKLISSKGNKSAIEQLAEHSNSWSIDIWSLGAILLEILIGVPLWMSLKCKVEVRGKAIMKHGLFAVKGRSYDKIYNKQKALVENFREHVSEFLEGWEHSDLLYDLLNRMLKWDPLKRISPAEILQHPYLSCQ